MIYFDTSYLVRLYYRDPGADAVRALAVTGHLACAAHGQAEMMADFHRKLQEGAIRPRSMPRSSAKYRRISRPELSSASRKAKKFWRVGSGSAANTNSSGLYHGERVP